MTPHFSPAAAVSRPEGKVVAVTSFWLPSRISLLNFCEPRSSGIRQPCPGIAEADQPQPDFPVDCTVYLFSFCIFPKHPAIRPSQDQILKSQ